MHNDTFALEDLEGFYPTPKAVKAIDFMTGSCGATRFTGPFLKASLNILDIYSSYINQAV